MDKETWKARSVKRTKWIKHKYNKNYRTYSNFKAIRNQYTFLIKKCNYKQEKYIATNIKDNPKLFWNYVRSKSKTMSGITSLKVDNEVTTDDNKIAEALNNHFVSVFTVESEPIPEPSFTPV